jgi:S1-C subfamily serine protease
VYVFQVVQRQAFALLAVGFGVVDVWFVAAAVFDQTNASEWIQFALVCLSVTSTFASTLTGRFKAALLGSGIVAAAAALAMALLAPLPNGLLAASLAAGALAMVPYATWLERRSNRAS